MLRRLADQFIRCAGIGAAAATLVLGATAADARTLSYTTSDNPGQASSKALISWAEGLKEATGGELEIEFYWQQSLSKLADNLDAVGSGLADMGQIIPAYSRQDMPLTYLSSTATGSGDPYVVAEAWNRTREKFPSIEAEDKKNNLKYLFNYSIGPVVLIGNKHYMTPEDFDGATMRLSSHFARTAAAHDWDVNPARVRFPEMYTALEKGTITGGSAYMSQILPFKLNEVADHGVELNLGQHMNMVYMSRDTWEDLPAEQQAAIAESLPDLIEALARADIESAERTREALTTDATYPMDLVKADDETREMWAEELKTSYNINVEDAAKVDPSAPEIAETYLSNIDAVEAEVDAKGYPWQ